MLDIKTFCQKIGTYRSSLMGFAIIWIIVYHSGLELGRVFTLYQIIGCGGVDIFLFISGYGIYHSLKKTNSLKLYYLKRLLRIYPAYIITLSAYFLINAKKIIAAAGLKTLIIRYLGNITLISQIKNWPNTFNWYVFCIISFYLISPLIYKIIVKYRSKGIVSLFVIGTVIGIVGSKLPSDIRFMFYRIDIYLLGMVLAYLKFNHPDLKIPVIIPLLISCYFLYSVWFVSLSLFKFFFITPGLVIVLVYIFEKLPKIVCNAFECFGKASFEHYLINTAFTRNLTIRLGGIMGWSNLTHIAGIVISVFVGFVFYLIMNKINILINRRLLGVK